MKTHIKTSHFARIIGLFLIMVLVFQNGFAQIELEGRSKLIKPEVEITDDIIWQVKAFHPDAKLLRIKAIGDDGIFFDVKAIQSSENTGILNVKAIYDGYYSIKVLPNVDDGFYPVKAILNDGSLLAVKAIAEDGSIMDVKGVSRSGNVINIMAISKDNKAFNIIAISPFGDVNVVKGLKMLDSPIETEINGVKVFAHVKAIKQN